MKRNVIINKNSEGGLQMPHLTIFVLYWKKKKEKKQNKKTWFKRVLDIDYREAWKTLLVFLLQTFCGEKISLLTRECYLKSSQQLNPFCFETPSPTSPKEVMSQPVWLNRKLKRDRYGTYRRWKILSFVDFRNLYQLIINFVDYFSLINATHLGLRRRLIRNQNRL